MTLTLMARGLRSVTCTTMSKGTTFKFLPPYSLELNCTETLWRLSKQRWMALTRRTKEEMEQAVDHVLVNFGGEFKMKF
jgi:hypothetical protein